MITVELHAFEKQCLIQAFILCRFLLTYSKNKLQQSGTALGQLFYLNERFYQNTAQAVLESSRPSLTGSKLGEVLLRCSLRCQKHRNVTFLNLILRFECVCKFWNH